MGVSEEVRRRLGKTGDDEVGEVLVCRLYKKMGKQRFNGNFRYVTKDISRGVFGACITCHSAKRATIKKTITIHERELSHLARVP